MIEASSVDPESLAMCFVDSLQLSAGRLSCIAVFFRRPTKSSLQKWTEKIQNEKEECGLQEEAAKSQRPSGPEKVGGLRDRKKKASQLSRGEL